MQWADLSEKGTKSLMNLLGAGAGARFIGKGLGPGGSNLGNQPGGYFGGKGPASFGPNKGFGGPPSSSAPRIPTGSRPGRTAPKPKYQKWREKEMRLENKNKYRKGWKNN